MQKEIDRLINSYRNNALSRRRPVCWRDGWRSPTNTGPSSGVSPAGSSPHRQGGAGVGAVRGPQQILFAVPEVNTRRDYFRRYVAAAAVLAAARHWPSGSGRAFRGSRCRKRHGDRRRTAAGIPHGAWREARHRAARRFEGLHEFEATLTVDLKFGRPRARSSSTARRSSPLRP